ncbi:MAG: PHP domain-containing protein [Anaerolineales bacterium]|nr:PHP domain-containing protein [Anaerolineales bacterium]
MPDSLSARVDLHAHSTASDGELTPAALVQYAHERGLSALALTDHDTVDGLDAAIEAARSNALELVPGVELSCDVPKNEVHILGYFIDWRDANFLALLAKFREGRFGRAEKMTKKLTTLGAPITFERVRQIAGDASIGRPHVAQALVEAGHVATVSEAFERFIGRTGPAYVERFRLTPEDAVALILRAGGVPVLAHPREVTQYIEPLVKVGLIGLEALYGMYDEATRADLVRRAKQYDLIVTGGSDFHGLNRMAYLNDLGEVQVPFEVVEQLRERATH